MFSKSLTIGVAAAPSAMAIVEMPAGAASAGEIKVLSVGSLTNSFAELIPRFEKSSGHKVKAEEQKARSLL
jgi:molybdate transport system substrate-binding protein